MAGKSRKFDKSHTMATLSVGAGAHLSDGSDAAPRLSEAAVHALAGFSDKKAYWTSVEKAGQWCDLADPKTYKDNLQILFKHLYERLDLGLAEAWESSFGYDGEPEDTPNEKWARMFSEMFVFAAYGGVADSYGTKKNDSGVWDMEYVTRLDLGQQDPVYPIVAACQHITNYGIVTRGIHSSELGPFGTTAGGGTQSCPCFTAAKGGSWTVTWNKQSDYEDSSYRKGSELIGKLQITPGSVVAFNSGGPDALDQVQAHIAGFLRVTPHQFQAIDTGPLGEGNNDTGTADHEMATDLNAGTLPRIMVGIGVLRKVEPSDAQLAFLATARPLGFAQLVFADEASRVRYISRVLPMHHGDKGFSIARYAWSLRCPPVNGKAFWILMYPAIGDFSRLLRAEGSRDLSVAELVSRIPPQGRANEAVSPMLGRLFKLSHVLASTKGYNSFTFDEGDLDLGWSKDYKDKFGTHPGKWLGIAHGTHVYRRKKHGSVDMWSQRDLLEPVMALNPFPNELRTLTLVDKPKVKLYDFWASMVVDQEYTCADPSEASNPQRADTATGLTYFDGRPAARSAAPSAPGSPAGYAPPAYR